MTYGRRAVNFRFRRYPVDARSGFLSCCDQPLGAILERPREQKRRARVGHHHSSPTCMGYRSYRCDCLPGFGPGGTPAFDLNDFGDFLGVRARRRTVAAVASYTCVPPFVSVFVTELAEFRIQTATPVNKGASAVSERVRVFVEIEPIPPVFWEDSGAGGGREKGAPGRRVVGLNRGANGE